MAIQALSNGVITLHIKEQHMPDESHPATDGSSAWLDSLLGKGKGDPDSYGYPGENDPNYVLTNEPDS